MADTPTAAMRMVQGLVRAAELLEQRDQELNKDGIWDSEAAQGLTTARQYGWGSGKVGTLPPDEPSEFERELSQLINRHCLENGSNTPDFLLARYLCDQLETFGKTTRQRDAWYGFKGLRAQSNEQLDAVGLARR